MADPEIPAESQETPPEEVVEGAEEETPVETAEEEVVEQTEEEKEKAAAVAEVNKKLGVPEKPKKKNDFQSRVNELTKNFREQERKAQELERKQAERDRDFELLRKHNEELMGVVKSAVAPAPAPEGKTPESVLAELKASKKTLILEKQRARTEVDYDKTFEIQDKIDEVQDKINDVLEAISKGPKKEDIKRVVKEARDEDGRAAAEREAKEAIEGFFKRNEWFGAERPGPNGEIVKNEKYDEVKHFMAVGMEDALRQTWKGTLPELFKHIETEIGKKFPAPAQAPRAKIPAVQGGNGMGNNAPGKVSLSAEQSRVARALFGGDPKAEEKYAEQLRLMGRR